MLDIIPQHFRIFRNVRGWCEMLFFFFWLMQQKALNGPQCSRTFHNVRECSEIWNDLEYSRIS